MNKWEDDQEILSDSDSSAVDSIFLVKISDSQKTKDARDDEDEDIKNCLFVVKTIVISGQMSLRNGDM